MSLFALLNCQTTILPYLGILGRKVGSRTVLSIVRSFSLWAPDVKSCSYGLHELDWMCIGSIHMNPHKIDAHSMHIWFRSGLDAYSSRIALTPMIHAKLCLPQDYLLAHWLGLWCVLYCFSLFCACSDVGQKRSLFLMAKKSGKAW